MRAYVGGWRSHTHTHGLMEIPIASTALGCGHWPTKDSLPTGRAPDCCTPESQRCEHLEVWKNFSYLPTELLSPFFFSSFLFCKFCKLLPCLKCDPENPPLRIKRKKVKYDGKVDFPSNWIANFTKVILMWIKCYMKGMEITIGIRTVRMLQRKWSNKRGWKWLMGYFSHASGGLPSQVTLCEKVPSEQSTWWPLSAGHEMYSSGGLTTACTLCVRQG